MDWPRRRIRRGWPFSILRMGSLFAPSGPAGGGRALAFGKTFRGPPHQTGGRGACSPFHSCALLELFPYTPGIHGVLRGGGLLGFLAAAALVHTFNRVGASIVAATAFLASLFLVTRFSFGWAAESLQKHSGLVCIPFKARWSAWQEARAAKAEARQRQQMEQQRATGKRPVLLQKVSARKAQPGQPVAMPPPGVPRPLPRQTGKLQKPPASARGASCPSLTPRRRCRPQDQRRAAPRGTSCPASPCFGLPRTRKELTKKN